MSRRPTSGRRPVPFSLTIETWGWLLFKVVLGLGWTHAMLFVTPVSIAENVSYLSLLVWTVGTMVGAVLSITGMLLGSSCKPRRALQGLTIELIGIVLFAGGPVQYLFLQIAFMTENFQTRYALAWFAGAMLLAIGMRALHVGRLFYKEATDPFKRGVE